VLAGLEMPLTPEQYAFCLEANQSSTEASMLTLTLLYATAGIFFIFSAIGLRKDLVGQN